MTPPQPWLDIPLADYEAHMAPQGLAALPAVRGYRLLDAEIATAGGGKRFVVQTFERID